MLKQNYLRIKTQVRIVRCMRKGKFVGTRVETKTIGDWQFHSGHINMDSASYIVDKLNNYMRQPNIAEVIIREY